MSTNSIGLFGKIMCFIHNFHFFGQYDKQDESDVQMIKRIARKFAILFFIIFMFDTLLDWFLSLMDSAYELIHLFVEFIEYSIEVILGYTLQTNHQESETIIVNATIIIGIYVFYRFCRALPQLFSYFKDKLSAMWLRAIERESSYWQALTIMRKIKLIAVYSIGITFLSSVLTV